MHGNIFMLKICIMYKSLNLKVIEDNFLKILVKGFVFFLLSNLLLNGNFDLTSYGQRFVLVSLTFIYLIHYLSICLFRYSPVKLIRPLAALLYRAAISSFALDLRSQWSPGAVCSLLMPTAFAPLYIVSV